MSGGCGCKECECNEKIKALAQKGCELLLEPASVKRDHALSAIKGQIAHINRKLAAFRIDSHLLDAMQAECRATGRSQQHFVETAIRKELKK